MTIHNVAFGCVTNSLDRVQRYILPRIGDRPLTLLWNRASLAAAYNELMVMHAFRRLDALILIHDDLEIIDPDAEAKVLAALAEPNVGVVAVAGARNAPGLAWWDGDTVGHQHTDSGMLDFGPRTGDIEAPEGSFLAFSRPAVQFLRFDERFDGFHGYDVSIGRRALTGGWRTVVADIDTHHHTTVGFKSQDVEAAWHHADQLFRNIHQTAEETP